MSIDRKQIIDFGKRLKNEVSEDDVSGAAAELAYRFFLALFPFFIFLAALGGFVASASGVNNPTDEIMNMVGDSLPADSSAVLRNQVEGVVNSQNPGLLSLGIIGAIWASSAGVGALMKNMNQIYEVGESRSLPVKFAIAIGLTILGAGLIVVAFVVLFVGQIYGPQIAGEIGFQDTAATLFGLARWPVAIVMVLAAVAFMYWLAPNANLPLKWITPGAIFFVIGWAVATVAFGFYVSNFGSYNETYGALGGVVILMLWFYLTAFLLLIGVEINQILAENANEAPVQSDQPQQAQARRADTGRREDTGNMVPKPVGVAAAGLVWVLALVGVLRRKTA